ncbi:MAG: CotH kinase family protein [Bacteroidota bacterium]
MDAFTDFLLINEFTKNSDGYKLSSYIHKHRDSDGGRLNAGPIWDFDQTSGLFTVCSGHDPTGWTYLQNQDGCEDLESMPLWWQSMMQDTLFQNRLHCRWTQFRDSFLHADSINAWIDTHVDLISGAIDRNFTVWDDFIGEPIWIEPEPIPQSYEEEIQVLRSWITSRLSWMDSNIPGNCTDVVSTTEAIPPNSIAVYPNPGHAVITIESDFTSPVKFELYSSLGVRMLAGTIHSNHHEVDISQLPVNIYFLRVGDRLLKVVKVNE